MDLLALQNLRLAAAALNSTSPLVADILRKSGPEQIELLLRHFAAEQYRYYFSAWGMIQVPGALLVAAVLYLAVGKRWIPQMLCGLMLALVLFQLAIQPEFTFRGREADFPPGNQSLGAQARVWALSEVWIGAESAKLLIGGLLTALMIGHKSRKRSFRLEHTSGSGSVERAREPF
jgi:hypothetical protein